VLLLPIMHLLMDRQFLDQLMETAESLSSIFSVFA